MEERKYKVRQWTLGDYAEACRWWAAHGKGPEYVPVPEFLPRAGFVVEDEAGVARCMGWLYVFLDVPMAQLGYLVANPDNRPGESAAALRSLLECVGRLADEQGWRLTARYGEGSLVNLLEREGWQRLIGGQVELLRVPGAGNGCLATKGTKGTQNGTEDGRPRTEDGEQQPKT